MKVHGDRELRKKRKDIKREGENKLKKRENTWPELVKRGEKKLKK